MTAYQKRLKVIKKYTDSVRAGKVKCMFCGIGGPSRHHRKWHYTLHCSHCDKSHAPYYRFGDDGSISFQYWNDWRYEDSH